MTNRVINKVTSTSGNLPPVLLDLTGDTVNERNLERDQTAHNSGGQKITGALAIEDAEAWARGTRNGTPVGPADETYNNNSKYYSIVSGSIMQMAGQQAIAAATSATNAAESERAAATSETNAKASEISAANSAVISGSCMNIAGVHAGDAEAWAIGKRNGQLVPPVDPAYNNNSKYYKELCESIAGSLASVLKPKGTCLFADLPEIADSQPGDTWNIEDEFTTTSDFREGAGRIVAAGSDIYLTIDLKWDVLAGTTSDYIGATSSMAAIHGLLPAAQAGDQDKVFKGDGRWHELDAVPSTLIENSIAPIENSNIATNNYVRGAQFIKGNYLFKAKTDISEGDTLVLDDNYEYAQEITDQIYNINVSLNAIIDLIYPINSVYISMINTNPGTRWIGTTWELLSDGYLRNNAIDATGGSLTSGSTTLTAEQIPSHSHTITTGSYGNHTHTLTTQNTGAHTHTATTGSYGNHTHSWSNPHYSTYTNVYPPVVINANYGLASSGGSYGDSIMLLRPTISGKSAITISSKGAHTHTLTTGSYGNHTHTATTQNTGAHTHTGTTQAIGGGQGHTHSIEPSYVRIYAYKRTA